MRDPKLLPACMFIVGLIIGSVIVGAAQAHPGHGYYRIDGALHELHHFINGATSPHCGYFHPQEDCPE